MKPTNLLFVALTLSQLANAGEAVVFDNPGLNIVLSKEHITGFYSAIEGNRACEFYIMGSEDNSKKDPNGYTIVEIKTFATAWRKFTYAERDRSFDIKGRIFRLGDEWIVQTADEPPGCGGSVGIFTKGPSDDHPFRYSVEKRFSAVAIRVVPRKTYLFDKSGTVFKKRKGYLTENDNVVALKTEGGFTSVRYTDPNYFSANPGAVIIGWVHSADLVDPFPPVSPRAKSLSNDRPHPTR